MSDWRNSPKYERSATSSPTCQSPDIAVSSIDRSVPGFPTLPRARLVSPTWQSLRTTIRLSQGSLQRLSRCVQRLSRCKSSCGVPAQLDPNGLEFLVLANLLEAEFPGGKSQAERGLFNMNATQHSQDGKTGTTAKQAHVRARGAKPGESVPDRDRKDARRGHRVRFAAVSARRASEDSAEGSDCYDTNSQTENQDAKVHRPQPAITANGGQVWLAGLLRDNGLLADRNERLWPQ